jgi:hypothetical protein
LIWSTEKPSRCASSASNSSGSVEDPSLELSRDAALATIRFMN